jgi:hypothetical protein
MGAELRWSLSARALLSVLVGLQGACNVEEAKLMVIGSAWLVVSG